MSAALVVWTRIMVIPRNLYFRVSFVRELVATAALFFVAPMLPAFAVSEPRAEQQHDHPDPPEQEHATGITGRVSHPMGQARTVLTCDGCGKPIRDLGWAMVFWRTDGPTTDRDGRPMANQLRVAHKYHQCSGNSRPGDLSEELYWFSSKEAAAARLAGLTRRYGWTAKQLDRLKGVAWAVPYVATPEEARQADDFAMMMRA
jgi:hypothetical protein